MDDTDSKICANNWPAWPAGSKAADRPRPTAVTVVLGEDTLVVTLHDALTPAEKALAQSPAGAARVQEFHRQLFADSMDGLRQEIKRITGRQVREAAAEIETATGTVVHAFTTGGHGECFCLSRRSAEMGSDADIDRGRRSRHRDTNCRNRQETEVHRCRSYRGRIASR